MKHIENKKNKKKLARGIVAVRLDSELYERFD